MNSLKELKFSPRFEHLGETFYTFQHPTPLQSPFLVAYNSDAGKLLGLEQTPSEQELVSLFSGNELLPKRRPLAMVYSGHQFGVYNSQLGDGRGLLLGEVRHAGESWDIHLKGAGKTPYSRHGDGRAVLRSCIREYLGSEAMHGLGIPTTRALAIIGSREPVYRERLEAGATLARLARTHIRFGHFEYFFYSRQHEALKQLADFVIKTQFPRLKDTANAYADFFREVVKRTARMIALWQTNGFAHGVMNTDNMSIIGDTFDYGPFGFLDEFNPGQISNHSDTTGRYAFDRQPHIGLWNLNALAHALSPLIERDALIDALSQYEGELVQAYNAKIRLKLGLTDTDANIDELTGELLALLTNNNVDYTIFFRDLCHYGTSHSKRPPRDHFLDRSAFDGWLHRYDALLQQQSLPATQRRDIMLAHNPKYILRNYLAQMAIDKAEQGDYSEIALLCKVLARPYDEHDAHEAYADYPPDWGKRMEISCSS